MRYRLSLAVRLLRPWLHGLVVAAAMFVASIGAQAQGAAGDSDRTADDATGSGPIRLRSNASVSGTQLGMPTAQASRVVPPRPPYKPGEFERFVQRLAGGELGGAVIRRFGADLMLPSDDDAADQAPIVPTDYLIKPGDEIQVTLWGSVDADLRTQVDRTGRITIPRVGPIVVAGVRVADLNETISRRVAQVFRSFNVSASLGQLRGVRVYVTGYATQPGAYNANSLSTLVNVLAKAGGPSAAGSFRNIQLKRGGQLASTFDLYDFLLRGDRSADRLLEAGDVIHVNVIGTQVAMIGSVNQPAIFEVKSNETLGDVLRMAGGFTAVADRSRVAVEKLDDRADRRIRQLILPAELQASLSHGDVLRAFSSVDAALPVQRQNKRVRIEGEVARPGEYVLPPESSIGDAIRAAGGMTDMAFVFGAEFSRESVRQTQQQNYERALRDLETDLARKVSSQNTTSADEASAVAARDSANVRLVARLRNLQPTGRVVLQLAPDARELPSLALEDGDRLFVPPRPTSVGVFGSVFNAGNYLFGDGRTLGEYLSLAGGATRGADVDSTFVIRANGSVFNRRANAGWFGGSAFGTTRAEPGDTIFVPEEMNKTSFGQIAKDWTQILYQLGIGAAAIKNAFQ